MIGKAIINSDIGLVVNVRSKKELTSPVSERVDIGTVVNVVEKDEEWSKIKNGRRVGYVMNRFLVFKELDD